jgi:hypothetical protein
MKFSIIIILIFFSFGVFCQTGTLLIGTITNDEILLAADSRSVYFESDDHTIPPIVYFDSVPKIFRIKQFAIAIAGTSVIGKTFYKDIISDYNKTLFLDTSLYKTLNDFSSYLHNRFPKDSFPEIMSNSFIIGGYVNNKPQLISLVHSKDTIVRQFSGTISSASTNKYAARHINKKISIYQKLENTIYDFAIGENRTVDIGGPISIISISIGNNLTWKQNDFSNWKYKNLNDFYNAVKLDKIKIIYLVPNGKERLLKIMRH